MTYYLAGDNGIFAPQLILLRVYPIDRTASLTPFVNTKIADNRPLSQGVPEFLVSMS